MRIVLKSLFKAVSALMTIAVMSLTLMPATDDEAAALGRDNNRFMLIQMRLANVMMTVAPEFAVARYSEATGLPPHMIRAMLEAKAAGEPIIPRNSDFYASDSGAGPAPEIISPRRRTEAGGALFVRPD